MLSSAAIYAALFLPVVLGQNTTTGSTNGSTASAVTPETGTSTSVDAPTVTGTACGTSQQNFNQCVVSVDSDFLLPRPRRK